jgi:hypothetical protein
VSLTDEQHLNAPCRKGDIDLGRKGGRWSIRHQRREDLVREPAPGYHALQLHRIVEGASS